METTEPDRTVEFDMRLLNSEDSENHILDIHRSNSHYIETGDKTKLGIQTQAQNEKFERKPCSPKRKKNRAKSFRERLPSRDQLVDRMNKILENTTWIYSVLVILTGVFLCFLGSKPTKWYSVANNHLYESHGEPNYTEFGARNSLSCTESLNIGKGSTYTAVINRSVLLMLYLNPYKGDLCNPCGRNCSGQLCDNWKCAIGCSDSNFTERVFDPVSNGTKKFYKRYQSTTYETATLATAGLEVFDQMEHKMTENVDFSRCHKTWKTNSIDFQTTIKHTRRNIFENTKTKIK